ncbi:Crp/Fnr family transcriptional regulator [Aestuariirhabdus litorea]|uniref:Crp/Fnr family transcriptional regulator n=1 Tax=Aestuariirhabdus litorea TaxID=2528527 RepID=UPI0013E38813|nr:Crp/Fnr family transcriptional regulator [Aestuariirhabdus litorea]
MKRLIDFHNWINGLSDPVRAAVQASMRQRDVVQGGAIFRFGEPASECYQVEQGRVVIYAISREGKELQLMELREGDCFGEMGLIDDLPRFNHAYAGTDTRLWVLKRADFEQLYNEYPEIPRQLNRYFCYRLRVTANNLEEASVLSLRERLARLITRLAFSVGASDQGVSNIEHLSHQSLSRMLGVTRQSVSRELKAMEREGLLKCHYNRIEVLDYGRLSREGGNSSVDCVPAYDE